MMDCSGSEQRPVLPSVTDSGVGEGDTGGDAGGGRAGQTEGDGGSEAGGGRAEEAGGSQNGRSKQIDDLLERLGLDVNFRNKLTKGCFLEISSSSIQNKESNTEKDLVHTFMQRLLTLDYTAKHLSVKTEGPVPKSKHTAGKGSFVAFFKKNVGNKENKPTQVHPMDVQMAVFFCSDPFLQQTMVTKLSQCQYAVPLLVPNPFTENTEFPLWTMRQISKSWKTTDTSEKLISKTLPMCKAQTPMVAFFRLGSISSSKSQLMNRLINEKHDTFFHRDCPGSSRERLLMDGVVEIAWYLPSGKSTDHFSDCVAFCNLHGDSSINETQRKILTEMSSVNIALLPRLDENDNNMVIVQELFESSKPLIVVLTDEDDEGEDDVCEIEEGKYRLSLKGRNQSDVSVCLRGVIKNCLSEQPVTFSLEKIAKHSEKTEENTQKTKENTEKTEEHTEKTEENTEKTEENIVKTEEHTKKTEENTEKTKENTEETEEHTEKTEENTEKTKEHTEETGENTEKTEGHTDKTEENTEKTEENTEKTEGHTDKKEENTEKTEENTEETEHTEKAEEHTQKTKENTEETEENTEKTKEHTEKTKEHTEETEEHTEETEEHTEETEEHTEETEENTEETEKNTEKTKEHTEKTKDHTEETEEYTEKTKERTEKTKEHTEKTKDHTEKTKEHTAETEEHTEKTTEHTEETEERIEKTEEHTEETEENTEEKKEHTEKTTEHREKTKEHRELKVDERNEDCRRGKEAAQKMKRFLEREDPSTVKEKYLPCHGKLWHEWSQKNKDLRRLKSENIESEKSEKEKELREIRKKQLDHGFSDFMGLFVGGLRLRSDSEKMYFLKWMTILLDDFTLDTLSNILQEYDQKWSEMLALKRTHNKENETLQKMKSEQLNLEKISKKLNAATFGLEHMLREMGQIYEASVSERREDRVKDVDLSYLPELAAELMLSGHPMELMDGDAAHVPLVWVSAVLKKVIEKLGDQRVFVLSVLGIQSSGKSTMLNAMFGLQFAVSAGRCTRGAFMQLVKVSDEMKEELKFDYILVVDTEGLRALELAGKDTIHHDNELATFVVGLGNMTLINIFGENPSEMQDILQIVVQAFMRMKQVRLEPSCVFVHQNVTDVAAGDKNMEGRRRLQEKLDEITKLAAKDEVYDAECFSDIIAFDVQKDVKYFSQLWEGSPPMAPPNPRYSENVQELKRDIVSRASKTNCIKLSQFQQRVKDLWEALLNENFVFSFRNTLEISVYRKLEEEYEKWTWSLRSAMLSIEDKMLNRISSGKLEAVGKQELMREMSETLQKVRTLFKKYFEEDSEKETLIQWKSRFETQIQHLHDGLVDEAKRKLDENIKQKNIRKHLDQQLKNHENTLFEKSKELALKFKDQSEIEKQNLGDPEAEFNSVWGKWVSDLTKDVPKIKDINISNDVINILGGMFSEYGRVFDQKQRAEYRKIHIVADYSSYVSIKRVKLGPFPLWKQSLNPEDQTSIRELISKVIQQTTEKVNSFPVSVQGYSSVYIQEIVRDVKQLVQEFKPRDNSFEFKKEFFVDLSLYVCEQAEKRFVELHRKYREANDPLLHFKMKKAEYLKVFMNYYQGATSAAVLGDQICVKLKETILQSVYNMTAKFICHQMRGKPPFNGNRGDLEKHFLKSLAEQEGDKEEKFKNFLTYMYQPRTYFEMFIKRKVKEHMAARNPQAVSAIKEHFDYKQRIVISAAKMARDEVMDIGGDVNTWLDIFSNSLVDELGDTSVHLGDGVTEDVTDYDILLDFIQKELPSVVSELKGSFCKLSDLKEEMFREKPEEILIKHFCRCCWTKCPFCGAVCTNSQEDHTGDHHVDFHRSSGIIGRQYRGTTEFVTEFCTTLVASERSFYPNDSDWLVPYKQYRTAGEHIAKWCISSDFSEMAYWKWFVCDFQKNLENHYQLTFSGNGEIPSEWTKFTQADAVASLGIN